ncbi:MAG: DUF2254 domain-containing protein, partial [Pseudomonadota bacterium]
PYFIYVFRFLEPERVIERLQKESLGHALPRDSRNANSHQQERVLEGIEQLADIAVNAVAQKDRIIASCSVNALKNLSTQFMDQKKNLNVEWFQLGDKLSNNPDFLVMSPDGAKNIARTRIWLEWKVLRQYQVIHNECLNKMGDICLLVAINTRYIGEKALVNDDKPVLRVAIKFFNTYLRASINRKDIRTAYNVFHQYRQLAERVMRHHWEKETIELACYFKYYAQTANAAGLSFVTETAAYDLSALCELAHEENFGKEHKLLDILLGVDKDPETEEEERSLRGVRKAQIKLATYYLTVNREDLARQIWRDMEDERPERLQGIRKELFAVETQDFWEVIDRGHNFDYLDPARKEKLEVFFSWFVDQKM